MKRFYSLLFLLVCSILPACAERNDPVDCSVNGIYLDGPVLCIKGLITLDDTSDFSNISFDQVERVTINSYGGDSQVAILIADKLRGLDKPVEVQEFCMSACAQYLMKSSDEIYVHAGTKVAFHHSTYAINQIYSVFEGLPDQNYMATKASSERSFYERNGVDLRLLTVPLAQLPLQRIIFDTNPDSKGMAIIEWKEYNFVAYSKTDIETLLGIRILGPWNPRQTDFDLGGNGRVMTAMLDQPNWETPKSFDLDYVCLAEFSNNNPYFPQYRKDRPVACKRLSEAERKMPSIE
ncbi:MAG: hypothetical protein AAGB04_08625 [Pseudomonadota bacterium]